MGFGRNGSFRPTTESVASANTRRGRRLFRRPCVPRLIPLLLTLVFLALTVLAHAAINYVYDGDGSMAWVFYGLGNAANYIYALGGNVTNIQVFKASSSEVVYEVDSGSGPNGAACCHSRRWRAGTTGGRPPAHRGLFDNVLFRTPGMGSLRGAFP